MSQLISRQELVDKMSTNIVKFQFIKSNNSIRDAYGTRNNDFIPVSKQPKTNKAEKTISFFDIEKEEWRSIGKNANFLFISTIDVPLAKK